MSTSIPWPPARSRGTSPTTPRRRRGRRTRRRKPIATLGGLDGFSRSMQAMVSRAEQGGLRALSRLGHMVEAQAKENSTGEARWLHGRPGPRAGQGGSGPGVVTGAHRRSIMVEGPTQSGGFWTISIGPTMRYSRRLELGFSGTDSRGRRIQQPPMPYLKPAFDFVVRTNAERVFLDEIGKALR